MMCGLYVNCNSGIVKLRVVMAGKSRRCYSGTFRCGVRGLGEARRHRRRLPDFCYYKLYCPQLEHHAKTYLGTWIQMSILMCHR